MSELVYLASPYTADDPELMEQRFLFACKATAALMRQGIMVFSPIAHTHPIARVGELPTGWEFWREYDRLYLDACARMIVLTLDGWEQSLGVADEIAIMQALGKPVAYRSLVEILEGEEQ